MTRSLRRPRTAAAFAVALAAATALGQKQTPPAPGSPKDFSIPTPTKIALENGMKVTLVPYGTIPKVTVDLAVLGGNASEGPNEVWLGDLMGTWMREGTRTKSASQISQSAARMGGSLDIDVGANATRITGNALSDFGPEMIRLVADVAENPSFPESELARLKADQVRQLSIAKSRPQQIALEKFRSLLYPNHAYGRVFPTPEMIQAFTAAGVRAFYDANVGAARAHLYVAGRFDPAAMEAAIREAFGGWKAGPPPSFTPPSPRTSRAIHLIDRPGAVQSTIVMGVPVIDPTNPDYVPLLVTNTLLGGYFSSRITSNIREAKGYTYSPFSQISVRYRDAYWAQNADVTTNVTGPSLKEIFSEIDRLQGEPPSAEELKAVQNYMAGVFVLQNSSRAGIIGQLEFVDLHGLPDGYLSGYVRRVYAVTPSDVQRMAQKYILDGKVTIVVVGDKKVIEEQIKPYGTIAP
ncbi:MAG TPA: pitrilysin family protein [Thermoanaerobaculia bacterium]|jgi:predicted Zn-dependent peptidase